MNNPEQGPHQEPLDESSLSSDSEGVTLVELQKIAMEKLVQVTRKMSVVLQEHKNSPETISIILSEFLKGMSSELTVEVGSGPFDVTIILENGERVQVYHDEQTRKLSSEVNDG